MNHPELPDPKSSWQPMPSLSKEHQIISTIALLVLGYYAVSFFDVWPSTLKRSAYEFLVYITPSSFVLVLQNLMMRFGGLPEHDLMFRREHFNDAKRKEEALRYLFGRTPIPTVLKKARTLSGYDRFNPPSGESGPPGLGNWDNSCYQNSVLQGLASLPAFQAYVHRSVLLCQKTGVVASTTHALAAFIDQLADITCRKTTLWTPGILKSMDSWQQQDAQEYFSRLNEAVEKEALQYVKAARKLSLPGLNCILQEEAQLVKQAHKDAQIPVRSRSHIPQIVHSPMDGMQAQALECQTCKFSEGISFTGFNCLTLNLGLGGECDVRDLLDAYTDPETIEGVECDECTRRAQRLQDKPETISDQNQDVRAKKQPKLRPVLSTKVKQVTIGRLPKDLIMHINRSIFDDFGNQRKNNSFVNAPERLEIFGRWCAPIGTEDDSVQAVYELRCMVTHSGRHDNGHYVAFAKRDKDWYCFNDEIVTKVPIESVLRRGSGFILFYEAIDVGDLTMDNEDNQTPASDASQAIPEPMTVSSDSSRSSSQSESFELPTAPSSLPPLAMRTAVGMRIPPSKMDPRKLDPVAAI